MTNRQYAAKKWLNRMYGVANHIESLRRKQEEVLSSLSGIGKYEEHIPGSDPNLTESKQIRYSEISAEIEKQLHKLHKEDLRTLEVIEHLDDEEQKAVLIDRYLNRLPWNLIISSHNYAERQVYRYHDKALEKIWPLIPRNEIYESMEEKRE